MDTLINMLRHMTEQGGSDLYLSTGSIPSFKLHGQLTVIPDTTPLQPGQTHTLLSPYIDERRLLSFNNNKELNFAISEPGLGRFRINLFQQRHELSAVIRAVSSDIPTMEELSLPSSIQELAMKKRGLILFVGATGTGKSTSLAAMVNHRNRNCREHIISIEDPIEYIHTNQQSIVNQREVGIDTHSYQDALKNALRQAPDVILIGEIRASDTMEHAISFAETGHLCLSTLHATNADQALDRIINFFPAEKRQQILLDLSFNLKGIVSQRLIPTKSGKRLAVFEILLNSPLISDLIRRGETEKIKEVMEQSDHLGMQTFDTSLYQAVAEGQIDADVALQFSDSANNLRMRLSQIKDQEKKSSSCKLELKADPDDNKNNLMMGLQESARRYKKRDDD